MFKTTQFFIAGILLCVVRCAKDEKQQTVVVHAEFDGPKLEITIPQIAGVTLLQHWTSNALAAFISAYSLQKTKNLNYFHRNEYSACMRAAESVKRVAECAGNVVGSIKSKKTDVESIGLFKQSLFPRGNSRIRQRILTLPPHYTLTTKSKAKLEASLKHVHTKHQKDVTRTAKKPLKTASKPPKKAIPDAKKAVKNSRLSILQKLNSVRTVPSFQLRRGLAFNTSLPVFRTQIRQKGWVGEFRLSRAKREVISKSDYKLINKDGGRSPLGVFARSLTNLLQEVKGLAKDGASIGRAALTEVVAESSDYPKPESEGRFGALRAPLQLIGEAIKLGLIAAENNVTDTLSNSTLADDIVDVNKTRIQDVDLKSFLTSQPTKTIDEEELFKLLAEVSDFEDAFEGKEAKLRKKTYGGLLERQGQRGQPLYFTKQNVTDIEKYALRIEVFEKLYSSLGTEQVDELNSAGFAKLSKPQLRTVYGSGSPYANQEAFERFVNTDKPHLQRYINKDIQLLSMMDNMALTKNRFFKQWSSLVPSLLLPLEGGGVSMTEPSVLNPLLLSPVALFPSVLGPFLLNPWTFAPILTTPPIDAPLLLLPSDNFPPLAFSPLVYGPSILTYGVVDRTENPAKRFSSTTSPIDSTPLAAFSRLLLNSHIFANSSFVTETFSKRPVNLSAQFIHTLMFPKGSNETALTT